MSATPALAELARAADLFASSSCHHLAAELRNARIELAELLDAAVEKLDEIDARTHGLADTPADARLRHAVAQLRPHA
jgi:hypothetical protein